MWPESLKFWKSKQPEINFPKDFLWGASMSAYQTEGGDTNNDWYKFEIERNIISARRAGIATDHYHRYKEDFDLAADLNMNTIRLSVEWSRIEPSKGKFDEEAIRHYLEVLAYLKKKKFTVILTLHHFTNPIWFADLGGWYAPSAATDFLEYSRYTVPKLGEYVDYWVTFNESGISILHGYLLGSWPPGIISFPKFYRAGHNMAKAHIGTYSLLKSHFPEKPVGVINNCGFSASNLLGRTVKWPVDYARNFYYLDLLKKKYDFIGVNYYFPGYIPEMFGGKNIERTDMDWPIFPKGIYDALTRLHRRYRVPLLVTENGLADANDSRRARFIYNHLLMVKKAMAHGAHVFGYLHWALTDNLELQEGFDPRFGLIEINYGNLDRMVRKSAKYYASVCKNGVLRPPTRL